MASEYRSVTGDAVADRIDALEGKIRKLAPDASARLRLAAANVRKVSPDATYSWVDPASFTHEIEVNEARPAESLSAIRNVLVVIPLTLTWLALALAAIEYIVDIKAYHDDIYQPFLALWQGGFPHAGWFFTFTLADIGILDCMLLLVVLGLTWREQIIQRRARIKAQALTNQLISITPSLVELSSRGGKPLVGPDASVQDVANAIQDVLDQAFAQTQRLTTEAEHRLTDVAEAAQRSILASQTAVEQLMTNHMAPMINRISGHLNVLQTQLEASQEKLDTVATASQQLSIAAGALERNAGAYIAAAAQISEHIEQLRGTQAELVTRIDTVSREIGTSATALQQVAAAIGTDMVDTVRETGEYLHETNVALLQTTQRLQHAANGLDTAVDHLAILTVGGKANKGFWAWLFGRD